MALDPLNDPLRALKPDLDERWERYDRRKLWMIVGVMALAFFIPILLLILFSP